MCTALSENCFCFFVCISFVAEQSTRAQAWVKFAQSREVVLRSATQVQECRQRQLFGATQGDGMQFNAVIIALADGAEAFICNLWCDSCASASRAFCQHDGQAVTQAVSLQRKACDLLREKA